LLTLDELNPLLCDEYCSFFFLGFNSIAFLNCF
jgi:hypothetical protein